MGFCIFCLLIFTRFLVLFVLFFCYKSTIVENENFVLHINIVIIFSILCKKKKEKRALLCGVGHNKAL